MDEQALRDHLVAVLDGRGAHEPFTALLEDFPPELAGHRVENTPHTPWRLLEHVRIAQWDILEFSRNPEHASPDWPDGYWPDRDAATPEEWSRSVTRFAADLEAMKALVTHPESDLFTPFEHGDGQTLLREALLVADHNAYHIGQMMLIRRMAGR